MTTPSLTALIQMDSGLDRESNLGRVRELVGEAVSRGAQRVCLPEMFAWFGPLGEAAGHAEPLSGPTVTCLRELAKSHGVWLVGGSLLEVNPRGLPFNTLVVVSPLGELVKSYRKIHLFDIDLPGRVTYHESAWLAPGASPVTVTAGDLTLGLSLCYDLRFPELYRAYAELGAEALVVSSAFAHETGRKHWEPLLRARAIENQCYVLASNQTGEKAHGFVCHGHSQVVDPWGETVAELTDGEGVVLAKLDRSRVTEVRQRLPALAHRRLGRTGNATHLG